MSFKLFFENLSSGIKEKIISSNFFKEIRYMGGMIYFVGGNVRDFYVGKESKDIDLLISKIPHDRLLGILEKHGKVSSVGESFGVIKFVPDEFEIPEPIDIALPRTERPKTQEEREDYKKKYGKYPSAYQSFTVEPDHSLRIEDDLVRRDFTINAIAQDHLGNQIDPYNGIEDIKNKTIRMVSPKNFIEDPLRMLRGVQFASRFGFKIEPRTFNAIKKNSNLINGIPGERILEEIKKIVEKGDHFIGANLLCETNLWQEISNISCSNHKNQKHLFDLSNISKTIAEFLFLMFFNSSNYEQSINVCKRLKCELVTEKQIKGLFYAWNFDESDHNHNSHQVVFNLNKIHPTCLNLLVLPKEIKDSINSEMPKSLKDLQINGKDLMSFGFEGESISRVFNDIINKIFNGNLSNTKKDLMTYLSSLSR